MPKKLPIVSSMKESEISVTELKELVNNYKGNSPFISKCVWISKALLDELARRNEGTDGYRIYFAGFDWNPKKSPDSADQNYEKAQGFSAQNAGPKKYQGLIFVSSDKEQEDLLKDDHYVIVGEKIEVDNDLTASYALKICPPPPPSDCKGDL